MKRLWAAASSHLLQASQIAVRLINGVLKYGDNLRGIVVGRIGRVFVPVFGVEFSMRSDRRFQTLLLGGQGNATGVVQVVAASAFERLIDYVKVCHGIIKKRRTDAWFNWRRAVEDSLKR